MQTDRSVNLSCRISRSGFSGERVFRVMCSDGSEHVGVAPTHYFRTPDAEELGPDMPPKGQRIDGLIEGVLIANGGEEVAVALPDGATIRAHLDQILSPESAAYVPI